MILFLTARDTVEDRVVGLRIGGDDNMTKPFSLDEVVARAYAILRRTRRRDGDLEVLRVGDVLMDTMAHEAWRNGSSVHLTATEFSLLRYFMTNARLVLSKTQILASVWADDFAVDENVGENLCQLPAEKARSPRRTADPHGQARRLHLPPGG